MRKLFIIILLAGGMHSCIPFKPVEVTEISSVNFEKASITSPQIDVTLKIKNPNFYKIKVKDINLEGFVSGQSLGRVGVDTKDVFIPKKSEEKYTITLKADVAKVLAALPSVMFTQSAIVGLKGNIEVKALLFKKKVPIDIKEKVSAKDLNLN